MPTEYWDDPTKQKWDELRGWGVCPGCGSTYERGPTGLVCPKALLDECDRGRLHAPLLNQHQLKKLRWEREYLAHLPTSIRDGSCYVNEQDDDGNVIRKRKHAYRVKGWPGRYRVVRKLLKLEMHDMAATMTGTRSPDFKPYVFRKIEEDDDAG